MKEHYPIELLERNAQLPDRERVLDRFRQIVLEGPKAAGSSELQDDEVLLNDDTPETSDENVPLESGDETAIEAESAEPQDHDDEYTDDGSQEGAEDQYREEDHYVEDVDEASDTGEDIALDNADDANPKDDLE